ncbi:MAG: amino acid permease [Candidatus Marinimicrobia bacterium]|nr:amino acid permease [Candidatus Neomarinimicrobiota bacterium]MDD5582116.1 amino acid permease [Candidatus Neomarinimicrobiota bacterium]
MSEIRRELSMSHVLAIIIGTVIGSGVFINLPIVQQATGAPLLAVLAWFIGGLIWLPQIFILSEMGTAYPEQGFGYLYLQKAGSPFLAFLYVWTVFWTSDTPSITILALSAVAALDIFFPILTESYWQKILATLIILILTSVHIKSVRQGGRLQFVLTILKISPLILLAFIGLGFLTSDNLFFVPKNMSTNTPMAWFACLMAGISGTIWSYAGFPNILYMAGEVKNPQKTLPRALLGSTIFVTLTYTAVAFATGAIIPHETLISISGGFANPFCYLPLFASFAGGFLAIAAFISMVGATNACIMVQPRIQYAMARDGLFFRVFGKLHPTFGTPYMSIILQSAIAILLIFMPGGIGNLLGYFTLSYVLQNLLVYASIFWLKKRDDYNPSYHAPSWKLMASLSILFQILLVYGTFKAYPVSGILAALVLIVTGVPVFLYFHYQQKSRGQNHLTSL